MREANPREEEREEEEEVDATANPAKRTEELAMSAFGAEWEWALAREERV